MAYEPCGRASAAKGDYEKVSGLFGADAPDEGLGAGGICPERLLRLFERFLAQCGDLSADIRIGRRRRVVSGQWLVVS